MRTTVNTAAYELRALYGKNISRGLLLAAIIHCAMIASYLLVSRLAETEVKFPTKFGKGTITVIPPPPSYENTYVLPAPMLGTGTAPSIGIPIPVPDALINPDATIATQDEINQTVTGSDAGDPNGSVFISDGTIIAEEAPPAFVPVEKEPGVVHSVYPPYPEIARRAGVEGTVYVKMWVTKEGKVKQAEIVKSSADLFNQVSLEAAKQWIFTPAIMNNGPVSVWVTVPFRFMLNAQ